ncbi:hypothetical protein SBRCBS47491_000086 [Sporothrix bragantina]|uniref:Uncharacterized protein n=1 Tax=Sporothrix bragantina TaxID=671064 RepID=A0ABP0ALV1_9PEZI
MYSNRPARPPLSAYQYNPQAVDDIDERDDQDIQAGTGAPGSNIQPRSNSSTGDYLHGNKAYDPYEGGQNNVEVYGNYGGDGVVVASHGVGDDDGGNDDPMEGGIDEATKRLRQHPLLLMPSSNYKPTPLRWPFLATLMAFFVAAIALIVYAHMSMPHSQSDATIRPERRAVLANNQSLELLRPRGFAANNAATPTMMKGPLQGITTTATTPKTSTKPTTSTNLLKMLPTINTGVVLITTSTPIATMTPTSTITVVSTGMTLSNTTVVITRTSSVIVTPTGGEGGGTKAITSVITTDTTATITYPLTTIDISASFAASGGGGHSTVYSTSESVGVITYTSVWTELEPATTGQEPPSYSPVTYVDTVTSEFSVPFTTTAMQTTTGHPYIVYGQVTITSSYTIAGGTGDSRNGNGNNNNDNGNGNGGNTNGDGANRQNAPATYTKAPPVTNVITTVVGGAVDTVVHTKAPQTIVQTVGGGVQTTVLGGGTDGNGVVETIVTRVGATPVTYVHGTPVTGPAGGGLTGMMVVTVTPSPTPQLNGNGDGNGNDNRVTVVDGQTMVNGATVTVVDGATVVPQFSTVGGTPVTVVNYVDVTAAVTTTDADGLPMTQMQVVPSLVTSVNTVGGTVVTVDLQTVNLQTVVTIDGTVQTLATPTLVASGTGFRPITVTEVTIVDGTPSTTVVVTTPTASSPLTFTVAGGFGISESYSVSMSGGSWITTVITHPPTTIVTSLSGHLTTIVSTPPPESTVLSTEPLSTMLSTIVSTPASSVLVTPTSPVNHNTSNEPAVIVTTQVYNLPTWHYFLATFLPAFVAVLLSLPLRVIDHNAKMYQPFHALTGSGKHHDNARGSESLTLDFSGLVGGIVAPVSAALNHGEPVPLLTTTLVALSSLMAPLATEALGIKLHGSCSVTDVSGCAGSLGVYVAPAFVLVGLLILMLGLLVALLILLRNWRTGLRANPWNLAGIAALTACPDLINGAGASRSQVVGTDKSLRRALKDRRFTLGFYETVAGHEAFGIVPVHEDNVRRDDDGDRGNLYLGGLGDGEDSSSGQPFLALTVAYRAAFAVFLAALLALVLVYHIVAAGAGGATGTISLTATNFGNWVATNSFGVRFAMAALGVVVSFCWTALFQSVATVAPFQAMSTPGRPQPPERSILLPLRPTNEISGLWVALRLAFNSLGGDGNRHERPPLRHAIYLGLVALMTLVSEFLPVLLANVPYNVTQTLESSVVCARLVAVLLVLMLLTLLASFVAVRWPALPADPRTIAGAMYYVVDSHVLPAALESITDTTGGGCVALMDTKEKTMRVRQLGRRYYYGDIVGRSGRRRFAVDADVTMLDPVMDHQPAATGDKGGPPIVSTAYRGGPFYVYNQEVRYQRQQQEEDPAFV